MKTVQILLVSLAHVLLCLQAASGSDHPSAPQSTNEEPLHTDKMAVSPHVKLNRTTDKHTLGYTTMPLEDVSSVKTSDDGRAMERLEGQGTAKFARNATERKRKEDITFEELQDLLARELEVYETEQTEPGITAAQRVKRDQNGGKKKKGGKKGKGKKNGKKGGKRQQQRKGKGNRPQQRKGKGNRPQQQRKGKGNKRRQQNY